LLLFSSATAWNTIGKPYGGNWQNGALLNVKHNRQNGALVHLGYISQNGGHHHVVHQKNVTQKVT
jgi:hypothetical protein